MRLMPHADHAIYLESTRSGIKCVTRKLFQNSAVDFGAHDVVFTVDLEYSIDPLPAMDESPAYIYRKLEAHEPVSNI